MGETNLEFWRRVLGMPDAPEEDVFRRSAEVSHRLRENLAEIGEYLPGPPVRDADSPKADDASLRVCAGQAAADLLAAANAHLAAHGDSPDSWTLAALAAVEALSDIATYGVERPDDSLPPPERVRG